jgi:mono/diheme cytochrome c family protein
MRPLLVLGLFLGIAAADPFHDQVRPLLAQHCFACHGETKAKAGINYQGMSRLPAFLAQPELLEGMVTVLREREMPPAKAPSQPSDAERAALIAWAEGQLHALRTANPGEPGRVVMPRLTRDEYANVIRDLSGVSIDVSAYLPVEGAAGEGFLNVGEAQNLSTALLGKYLAAATAVLSHARIGPASGLVWSPTPQMPVSSRADELRALVMDWLAWHDRQASLQGEQHFQALAKAGGHSLAWYLEAVYRERQGMTPVEAPMPLSSAILANVRNLVDGLERAKDVYPPLAEAITAFRGLPAGLDDQALRTACRELEARCITRPRGGKDPAVLKLYQQWGQAFTVKGYRFKAIAPVFVGEDPQVIAAVRSASWRGEVKPEGPVRLGDLVTKPLAELRREAAADDRRSFALLREDLLRLAVPDEEQLAQAARGMIAGFAARAWRHALVEAELARLLDLYRTQRAAGAPFATAVTASLTAVLVAPDFLWRWQTSQGRPQAYALAAEDLVERLAFVIWGSLPDETLIAAEPHLAEPAALDRQVRRMLADPRARHLARAFAGQWLRFADFAGTAAPDPELFPDFTEALKADMVEEVTRFTLLVLQDGRPLMELFLAEDTVLNERLAKHYGIPGVTGDAWRVVRVAAHQRGGFLGQGAFLIGTSLRTRTSPIKRGVLLLEDVLGDPLPAPPVSVPPLSEGEVGPSGETIAQQMARHRSDPNCFTCHVRIDPLGLSLERFDAVGRFRDRDRAGHPIDDRGEDVGGRPIPGIAGLRSFLAEARPKVLRHACRKLLGYCLGRGLQPSDESIIETMMEALDRNHDRFDAALVAAVTSQAFTHRRDTAPAP